jgi:uncharacterized membrane protein YhhN
MLAVYAVVAAAHLVSLAAGLTWLEWATKFLLVPSLAAWVATRRGPQLLLAALVLSALGDMALQFDALFILGMGFFAAAHVCYVTFLVRAGALAGLRRRWFIPVAYGLAWAVLVTLLWPRLDALAVPVVVYALLLTATATTSAGLGARTGIGGLLFFVSDGLISLGLADAPQPPMASLWVMSTYIVAQYLLASGALSRSTSVVGRSVVVGEAEDVAGPALLT